jgi:hypothetical protein
VYTHPEVTIVGSPVVQDINTLCITDVDASYVPPAKRESGINLLEEGELLVTAGQHIDVPLNTLRNLEIGAISLELTIPESLQFEAATISQNPENLFYTIDGNRLLLAWSSLVPMNVKTGEAILSLRFNPLGLLNAPTALHFTAGAECELANAMAQVLHNETLSIPKLVTTLSNNALTAYEPYPNPFTEYCNIPLYLPETANVSISLKNLQGMEVERQEYTTLAQGEHLLKLWRENLAPGSYYAEIILNGTSSFRKFTKPLIITK